MSETDTTKAAAEGKTDEEPPKKEKSGAAKFFGRMGGAIRDGGKVSKYKTEASLLCGNIKKRKAQWGVECYDLMHPDYQEDEVKRRFKLVLAHVQKLEGQLNKVQEKIDNLDYGKEPKEGAKKAGKDAEEKLAEDLDEKVAVAQP